MQTVQYSQHYEYFGRNTSSQFYCSSHRAKYSLDSKFMNHAPGTVKAIKFVLRFARHS